MKSWQRKLFAITGHVYPLLVYTKHYEPIKLMAVTGNQKISQSEEPYRKT